MRREWRQLGVLVVAMCLVTAFFALGPLYTRAMIQSGLQHELDSTGAAGQNLTFIGQSPYRDESWAVVNDQLGTVNAGLIRIARSALRQLRLCVRWPPTNSAPFGIGFRVCLLNLRTPRLIDGRWRIACRRPTRRALAEEQVAKGLGIYSRGDGRR
jgi:hypothetical protein